MGLKILATQGELGISIRLFKIALWFFKKILRNFGVVGYHQTNQKPILEILKRWQVQVYRYNLTIHMQTAWIATDNLDTSEQSMDWPRSGIRFNFPHFIVYQNKAGHSGHPVGGIRIAKTLNRNLCDILLISLTLLVFLFIRTHVHTHFLSLLTFVMWWS